MPQLVELLTQTSPKTKSKIKPTQNFLMQTLKELSPKKAIDFLKSLNLDKKEIKDIILKLPKNEQSKYLNILDKEFLIQKNDIKLTSKKNDNLKPEKDKKEELKTDIKNLLKELDKKSTSKITEKDDNKNETSNIVNTLLTQNNNTNPKTEEKINKIKKDILEIIKKEIDSNKTLQNLLKSQKTVTEIKNASSFKELVEIANKNGLNIQKIVTEIIKPKSKNITTQINTKSNLPNFRNIITQKKIIFPQTNITQKKEPTNNKSQISSITQLLNKKSAENSKTETKSNLANFNHILNTNTQNKKTASTDMLKENLDINALLNKKEKKDTKKVIEKSETNNYEINSAIPNEIKNKVISAKETLRHFSANIKDAIENYKPPVSKISLELNPKELGKVDITIIKRGDNLQVQINSNNNAINLFHTHQNDLKTTLVNMGFNGVDMQFNSNQNNKERQQKAYKQYSQNKDEEYDELIIEIPYQYA